MTHNLHKILHIDDDPVMRMMTKKSLQRSQLGFDIMSCATAHDFLETLGSFTPDLLLVDYVMPVMDGEELISNIRSRNDVNRTCPVVFVSGKDLINFRNRVALEPVLGIIQKPFSPTTLGKDLIEIWKTFLSHQ